MRRGIFRCRGFRKFFIAFAVLFICVQIVQYSLAYYVVIFAKKEADAVHSYKEAQSKLEVITSDSSVCKIRSLSLDGHDSTKRDPGCPTTQQQKNWGDLSSSNNTWHLNVDTRQLEKIECNYQELIRVDDFKMSFGPLVKLVDGQFVDKEVILVSCTNKKSGKKFKNLYPQVVVPPSLKKEQEPTNNNDNQGSDCKPLNVILMSYDSVSRPAFIKRLPKTVKFLNEILDTSIIEGYNIIGDGTPAALIPIYAGSTEEELPSVLKGDPKGKYVDEVYPFLWKELHNKGYKSLHLDDAPSYGAFTYRFRGFKDHVTTHYFRHFQRMMEAQISKIPGLTGLCLGETKRHKVNLNLLAQFQQFYQNKSPQVVFSHWVANSHDDQNKLNWVDQELYDYLTTAHKRGVWNDTSLILFSDHGPRFTTRSTSGKVRYFEERMPFVSVYLPPAYRKANPSKFATFKLNAHDRLTSPFDLHETVRDLTCSKQSEKVDDVKGKPKEMQRRISLLDKISERRSCSDIGIPDHYCICEEPWEQLPSNLLKLDEGVQRAFQFSMDSINSLTEQVRNICHPLKVKEVIVAEKLQKNDHLMYKLTFRTAPNNGIYEALVYGKVFDSHEFKSDKQQMSIRHRLDISRIDAYGNQPHCITHFEKSAIFELDLRKFCICRDKVRFPFST